ncbi:hypothetical protein D3C81_2024290 [compost metagenome]
MESAVGETGEKALPKKVLALRWAYLNLAKLGRWYDSKRTERMGWVGQPSDLGGRV